MGLKTVVVIGSRKYRAQSMVYHILDRELIDEDSEAVVILSGKCPKKESVDNWAILWAKQHRFLNMELGPRYSSTEYFFERNKQMAYYADEIIAFIPYRQLRSGTWNCIKEFRKLGKTNYRVFDENGKEWDRTWAK